MEKLRHGMDKVTEWMAISILAVMTILVTWQVITRFIFHAPSTITEASAKYLFLWLVMITSAYVIGKREHMRLEFFERKLSPKNQKICNIFTELVVLLFCATVLTYGGGYIALNAMTQTDSALPIPIGLIYFALPIGGALSVVYCIMNIIDLIKGKQGTPDFEEKHPEEVEEML